MSKINPQAPISPTVGRVVHFHLGGANVAPAGGWGFTADNTYAAHVAKVHSDRLVNLLVIDGNGQSWPMQSIPLRQPDDEQPLGNWCEWMPYQKGQAAKAEQLEASLAAADRVHRAHESGTQRIGEPPTLNTAVNEHTHPHAVHSRHPVIGAAQQLDNEGNALKPGEEGIVTGDGSGQALPTIPQD